MPMFKALVLTNKDKYQITPGEDSPHWLPIDMASIDVRFSLGPRAFQLPHLYVSHIAVH